MIWKYKHGNVLIMDLESSNHNEAKYIGEEYQIPEHFIKKIMIKDFFPILDNREGFIFISFNFPTLNNNMGISFISGDNILIISHNKQVEPILKFYKDLEIDLSMDNIDPKSINADIIMIKLINKLFEYKIKYLEKIKSILNHNINKDKETIYDISNFLNKSKLNISLNKELMGELDILIKDTGIKEALIKLDKIEEDIKIYKKINEKITSGNNEYQSIKNKKLSRYIFLILLVLIIMVFYLIWL